jgi:hypothetical protein
MPENLMNAVSIGDAMIRLWALRILAALCVLAAASGVGGASAAVLIRSFQFTVCVTDAKHPDGCKSADADATVIVSEDKMETLKGEVGQGASIEMVLPKGYALPSPTQTRHRHGTPD